MRSDRSAVDRSRCASSLRDAVLGVVLCLSGCASIPPEAPELSAHLGSRISAMEAAHRTLLSDFFNEKKRQVDDFIQREWIPEFAKELFEDERISRTWDQVVQSNRPADRLQFIRILGPRVQRMINEKRVELVRPLEELESTVAARLKAEYDSMRAVNNTLTSFLQSASKVEENRKRYLEMLGIKESEFEEVIHETGKAVSELTTGVKTIESKIKDAAAYRKRIDDLASKFRKARS
jgi:hypothetical protein